MPEALCFDPGSQRGDPSIRLTADQVTALQALVSGAWPSARRTVTGVGDSIMGYGDATTVGYGWPGATSQSHVAWASSQMPGRALAMVANRAVGGSLIDGAVAGSLMGTNSPQITSALTDNSDILWVHTGVNHLNPSIDASVPSVETILEKFRRLLDLASPIKPLIVLDALTPINAGAIAPSNSAGRRNEIPLINAGLQAIAANYKNVIYNDVYSPLAIDADGNAEPTCVLATDGTHLTTKGAYLAGVASAATLGRVAGLLQGYRAIKTVLFPNFSGAGGNKNPGGGTINGSIASNLQLTIVSGSAIITADTNTKNKQHLIIDNSAGGASVVAQLKLVSNTAYNGSLANGDIVIGFYRIEVVSQSQLRMCRPTIQLNPAGSVANVEALCKSPLENAGPPVPTFPTTYAGTFQTPPWAINAAVASFDMPFSVEVGAGGSAEIYVSGAGYNAVVAY